VSPVDGAAHDLVGMDPLARSFARHVARMAPASLIAIHGAPGSAKREFLQRFAILLRDEARTLSQDGGASLASEVIWFDAWTYSKQGNVLAGLVSRLAATSAGGAADQDRARDVVAQINRLHLEGTMPTVPGPALNDGEIEPVERLQRGFSALAESVKAARGGRPVIIVKGLDRLSPALRWQTLEGLRMVLDGGPDVAILVSVGRQAAAMAVRHHEGDLPAPSLNRVLANLFDLDLTVPNLEVRRIGPMVQRYLGDGEAVVRAVFGPDSVTGLSAAAAHRPLGAPRFAYRLAQRVLLLAEYAAESRVARELSESQWCWVIVSERWPEFRRFMIRGGRRRWAALRQAVASLATDQAYGSMVDSAIVGQLDEDPILADYLKQHADGFERDTEGIFWLENLLLAAGL
jgi:hypothetical protein